MMNAKEAKEVADQATTTEVERWLVVVMAEIENLARKGFKATTIFEKDKPDYRVELEIIKILRQHGYKVENIDDQRESRSWVSVNWV